jgi:transcriptional regulator with XRE-family HTH domain
MAPRARNLNKSIHSVGQRAFCELITEARQKADLTQHDVAKRLGKPQSFVAKYESGERRLDIIEFIAICGALSADPVKLLRKLIAVV